MFKRSQIHLAILSCFFVTTQASAEISGISPSGFTGALSTPVAKSLDHGNFALGYSNSLDSKIQNIGYNDHNYVLGIGILPNVELFGRLADRSNDEVCFSGDCIVRDLSASLKITLPTLPWGMLTPNSPLQPQFAIGATDIGGAAANFQTVYGVASWQLQDLDISLGYSEAKEHGLKNRVDGTFANIIYQATPWAQGIAEYDGNDAQLGLRALTPPQSLPANFNLSADLKYDFANDGDFIWGLSLQRPLAFYPDNRPSDHDTTGYTLNENNHHTELPKVIQPKNIAVNKSVSFKDNYSDNLATLKQALKNHGFDNIVVYNFSNNKLVITLENQLYQWNELDAIGAILAIYYKSMVPLNSNTLEIILTKESLPSLAIEVNTQCLDTWLATSNKNCQQQAIKNLITDSQSLRNIMKDLENHKDHLHNSSLIGKPRITLAPVLNYALGTELGVFDYSVGVSSTLEIPLLWDGLLAEARYIHPVDNSIDFEENGAFHNQSLDSGIDRAMLHQYFGASKLNAHIAVGQLYPDTYGTFAETRYVTPNQLHQFNLTVGYFQYDNVEDDYQPVLAGYRYQFPNHDVQLELKAGQFLDGDIGMKALSRFTFSDTDINVFYQQTKQDNENSARSFAGLEIVLPLTPKRAFNTNWLKVSGDNHYTQSIRTEVNTDRNLIAGSGSRTRLYEAPLNLDNMLYNRDRLSHSYIYRHFDRIKSVFIEQINK